jgi:HEAT repeat protein
MDWQQFLQEQAEKRDLSPEETETLLKRFPEKDRYIKSEAQFTTIINDGISETKHKIGEDAVTKRMQEIYKKFQADCPKLQQPSRGKLGILRQFLIEEYEKTTTNIKKRCVLGLKGNYQQAQEKITEITQHLQTFLNDKTLSIANIEEGSIIIIVESSQSDYDQIKKRLIGQEIAGFPVEYVIDEWQDVCRRMLKKQTQLTSNSVLRRTYCNRNLIDEDLFVDLALVQPKRDRPSQYQQDIEPDRCSQFYTQQEVEKRFVYPEFLKEVISQRSQKNIAIIGEPGAGKTTLLQKLAFWLLQETDDLVIWISLGELGEKPLGDYLQEKWLKDALSDTRDEIKADWEQKFKGGAVWLLLDGLDEMGDTARQSLEFQGWVTQAQLIISCRLNLWQANPSQLWDFQTYLTQPFQDEQMQQFIQRWFRNLSGEKQDVELAESLWSALQNSGKERIKDLCRNPLRLTLLCPIWQDEQGDLPDTTAELYESFVESIYKWKKKEFPMKKAERDSLNAGLGELAKASLDGEGIRFRLTHRFVCKYLGEPDENSLLDSALKLGWLNEVGVAAENRRERVYAFYHATFQEYFAAFAVDDWDDFLPRNHVDRPVEGKRYRIFEPQWKHVILLWLGREDVKAEEKEGFIRALVELKDGVRDFYGYQAYFLAAAGINEFKTCSLASEIVRQVVAWGFGYFNIEEQEWQTFLEPIREGARKVIPETIRPLAITELIDILDHCQDEDTRWQAAQDLGEIGQGNPQAIASLVKLIDTTESEDTRRQAVRSLGEIGQGNPQAIASLVKLIETTEDDDTQREAAESLGKIDPGNPQAIAVLVKLIEPIEDEDGVFWRAAEIFGKIVQGNSQVIASLVKLIDTTEDDDTQWQAAEILGEIGQGNPQAIASLVKLIDTTESEDTRRQAAWSLGKIDPGNPQAIAALVKLLQTTESDNTRIQAAESLGEIDPGNPQVIAGLVKVIETTESDNTRRQAAESLGEIDPGNPQAIAVLVKLIETTEDSYTRWQAAQDLGEIGQGNPQAIAGLVKVIETTESDNTRMQAAESLGKIGQGNPQAIAGLVKLIETTESDYTRRQAAESLGEIDPGNPQAIAGLVKVIETTEYSDTRSQAAGSLGKIGQGNPQAIAGLVKLIETTENGDKWAAWSLGEIGQGNPQAIAGLVKLIETTESDNTQWQAAEILGKIGQGNPQAIAGLVKVIETTESDNTQWQAAKSLGEIDPGNPQVIAVLVKLIETTESDNTRMQAAWRLQAILTTHQQYAGVVSALALKDNLSDEVYQNNFKRFDECYKVVWHCAENLPYPQFYQAWHHPPTTPHPEIT